MLVGYWRESVFLLFVLLRLKLKYNGVFGKTLYFCFLAFKRENMYGLKDIRTQNIVRWEFGFGFWRYRTCCFLRRSRRALWSHCSARPSDISCTASLGSTRYYMSSTERPPSWRRKSSTHTTRWSCCSTKKCRWRWQWWRNQFLGDRMNNICKMENQMCLHILKGKNVNEFRSCSLSFFWQRNKKLNQNQLGCKFFQSPTDLNDFKIKERVRLATSLSCQTTKPVMNIDNQYICKVSNQMTLIWRHPSHLRTALLRIYLVSMRQIK